MKAAVGKVDTFSQVDPFRTDMETMRRNQREIILGRKNSNGDEDCL